MAGLGPKVRPKGREAVEKVQKFHTRNKLDYSVEELEEDIARVSKAYVRLTHIRRKDAIYDYLKAVYRLRLKWDKLLDRDCDVWPIVKRKYRKQMVGRAKRNASRLIVRLSATDVDDKIQAKYTNALNYALANEKKVSEVARFIKNARVKTSDGKIIRGINACQQLNRSVPKKSAIKRMGASRPRPQSN
jgi:hypothetical protein